VNPVLLSVLGGGWYPTLPTDKGTPQRPNMRATPQGLDQRSKLEEVGLKLMCRRGQSRQIHDHPDEGELVPAVDDRRRCKKNNFILPEEYKKKAVTMAGNLAKEILVREISSSGGLD